MQTQADLVGGRKSSFCRKPCKCLLAARRPCQGQSAAQLKGKSNNAAHSMSLLRPVWPAYFLNGHQLRIAVLE